jgi:ABC-2 type transport system permease protein
MFTLIGVELFKIFRKWRTYIGFAAVTVLVLLIQTAIYFAKDTYVSSMTRGLDQAFMFTGNLLNGYLIAHLILGILVVHVPFLVTLVAGDLLAGEATAGTYRILLTRPVSRLKVLTAKYLAGVIYANLLVLWLAALSLGFGFILFGTGELIVMKSYIIVFAQNDIIWRFAIAYAFAGLSMTMVATLAFFFSSLVENSIGPIISTMAIIIVFVIITSIKISIFESISPWLFTSYMNAWSLPFDDPIEVDKAVKSAVILLAHIIGLFGITAFIFKRKDILS